MSAFLLLLSVLGAGCEKKNERDSLCYQGKVVSLGCQNIIEIVVPAVNGKLSSGTLSFDPKLSKNLLKIGDVVQFKIIQYEDWIGPATAECLWPRYVAQVEFCNN